MLVQEWYTAWLKDIYIYTVFAETPKGQINEQKTIT